MDLQTGFPRGFAFAVFLLSLQAPQGPFQGEPPPFGWLAAGLDAGEGSDSLSLWSWGSGMIWTKVPVMGETKAKGKLNALTTYSPLTSP